MFYDQSAQSGTLNCGMRLFDGGCFVGSERRKMVTTPVAMAVSIQANARVAPIASKGFAANMRAIILIRSNMLRR